MSAADGFGDHSGLIIAATPKDGDLTQSRLWDVAADAPVGDPADEMAWVSDDVVLAIERGERKRAGERRRPDAQYADGPAPTATPPTTSSTREVSDRRPSSSRSIGVIPIDPATGKTIGTPIEFPDVDLFDYLRKHQRARRHPTASRSRGSTPCDLNTVTAVFDLATGQELARGLVGDVQSVATSDGDIISANAARVARSTAELEPRFALSKSGRGAEVHAGRGRRPFDADVRRRQLRLAVRPPRRSQARRRDRHRMGQRRLRAVGLPQCRTACEWSRTPPTACCCGTSRPTGCSRPPAGSPAANSPPLEWSTYFGDEPQSPTCAGVLG